MQQVLKIPNFMNVNVSDYTCFSLLTAHRKTSDTKVQPQSSITTHCRPQRKRRVPKWMEESEVEIVGIKKGKSNVRSILSSTKRVPAANMGVVKVELEDNLDPHGHQEEESQIRKEQEEEEIPATDDEEEETGLTGNDGQENIACEEEGEKEETGEDQSTGEADCGKVVVKVSRVCLISDSGGWGGIIHFVCF